MKKEQQDFSDFNELKINFLGISLTLVIFVISLGFLLETALF
jgi:hypothetical protein